MKNYILIILFLAILFPSIVIVHGLDYGLVVTAPEHITVPVNSVQDVSITVIHYEQSFKKLYINISGNEQLIYSVDGVNETYEYSIPNTDWVLKILVINVGQGLSGNYTTITLRVIVESSSTTASANEVYGVNIRCIIRVESDSQSSRTSMTITVYNPYSWSDQAVVMATVGVTIGYFVSVLLYILKYLRRQEHGGIGAGEQVGLRDLVIDRILMYILILWTARAFAGEDAVYNPIGFVLNGILGLKKYYGETIRILEMRAQIGEGAMYQMFIPPMIIIMTGIIIIIGGAFRRIEVARSIGETLIFIGRSIIGTLAYMIWWIAPILSTLYVMKYALQILFIISPTLAFLGLFLMGFPPTKNAGAYIFVFFLLAPASISYTIVWLEHNVFPIYGIDVYTEINQYGITAQGLLSGATESLYQFVFWVPRSVVYAVEIFSKAVLLPIVIYSIMIAVILVVLRSIATWLGAVHLNILETSIMRIFMRV